MTLEAYLLDLHRKCAGLVYDALWSYDLEALTMLLTWSHWRVCCSPENHRREWRYAGQQKYICEICERIKVVA